MVSFCFSMRAEETTEQLLNRLDSMIASQDVFMNRKLAKIKALMRDAKNVRTVEERYWANRHLYDEYFVFSADSAMKYANENLRISIQQGNGERENEWRIKRSFLFSVMGLLKESEEELSGMDPKTLPQDLLGSYYSQRAYLYSHLNQFAGDRPNLPLDYAHKSSLYEDSTFLAIPKSDPQYLWHKATARVGEPERRKEMIEEVKSMVDKSALDSRQDAMNAYVLSRLYGAEGDEENHLRYLIKSGIADVAASNRDIASLEELADILKKRGDIERAYRYINYCQQQAFSYPNHVRAATLAKTEAEVHKLYMDKIQAAGRGLSIMLWCLVVVMILLVAITAYAVKRRRKLARSQKELRESNERLNANLHELSESREAQENTLLKLQEANDQISEINRELKEANYVKEECIGATFALSSSYIDKLSEFRKTVNRLVRSNSWKELRELVSGSAMSSEDLRDLYHSFDTLFLNIYPDFVKDFNALLRPEEQITVKPGELNTELRIYALVRLGISDSVKIASVLHCSPQTVYNYRLKARNKAVVPREQFAEIVKSLGKFQN